MKRNIFDIISQLETSTAPAPVATVAMPDKPIMPKRPAIQLNEQQLGAIENFKQNRFGLLIGYAGTGKTTTVAEMLRQLCFDENNEPKEDMLISDMQLEGVMHLSLPTRPLNIALCAFTGMAVKQLRKNLFGGFDGYRMNLHAYTIHKLIDYGPEDFEFWDDEKQMYVSKRIFQPHKDKNNKLPFDIVIIDEVSMVGDALMQQLLDALRIDQNTRIYGIGDIAQIPPIFSRSTMLPMLAKWPISELTTIYRQKDGSIIDNANRIRAGENPIFNDTCKALAVDKNIRTAQSQIIDHMRKEFEAGNYDPEQDIILTTNNRHQLGQEMLNLQMRRIVNADAQIVNVQTMRNMKQYAVGDRVMVTRNDANKGVFNGMIGIITDIIPNSGYSQNYHTPESNLGLFTHDEIEAQLEEKQTALEQQRKLARMSGTQHAHVDDEIEEEDDSGTGKRQSSHNVHVIFPDEDDRTVVFNTSSEIENLIPAWVITVHKSQGSGFRNVYFILHDCGGQLLFNELFYTGFTRCQESIKLFTTRFALNKAIANRRIEGNTLDQKMSWFRSQEEFDTAYLPDAQKL